MATHCFEFFTIMGALLTSHAAPQLPPYPSLPMAKKKARSSSPPPQENTITEKQKPGHEIEEIFKKKRKKPEKTDSTPRGLKAEQENLEKNKKEKKTDEKPKKKKKKGSLKGDFQNDPIPRPRRKTQDGLTIYSAEELGVGNPDAGSTPLCPFDCSCCF
ncbi:hypothetical protein ACLOJK_024906 [Asimina triloba]